jgi:plastocyanin domain-containing protein
MNLSRFAVALALVTLMTACKKNATSQESPPAGSGAAPTALAVTIDASGYHPASLTAPAGKSVRLVMKRTSDEGCGQQVVFPSLDIRRDLPLNQEVPVEFTMPASGSVAFTCGMDMLRGSIVAQ